MYKKIKITEDQFNEFVDKDGSIASGDYNETDGKTITNYYRKNKRPQTSDDFADETGQLNRWYYYRGFAVAEGKMIQEQNTNLIPDISELSKSYEKPELQSNLNSVIGQVAAMSDDKEDEQDVRAIVLKEIIQAIPLSSLNQIQQQEIIKLFQNGK